MGGWMGRQDRLAGREVGSLHGNDKTKLTYCDETSGSALNAQTDRVI